MTTYYTLKATDVNRANISCFGKIWQTSSFIGRVLPGDVGKRVYLRGDILQVENDEQRNTRIATGGK
jgi:hypothetical protein